jgi:hypothetical protein
MSFLKNNFTFLTIFNKVTGIFVGRSVRILLISLVAPFAALAQFPQKPGSPTDLPPDTSMNKTNDDRWKNEAARIVYKKLNSDKAFTPDTSIHSFHRRPFLQPWHRDLGNTGTPTHSLFFTPEKRIGPTLGYRVFDVYRFEIDSLNYYNTNKPWSAFNYRLGSKLEQVAEIMHTQNIKSNWNVFANYRKINSPGYYLLQRTNNDNANFTTYYQGKKLHYELYGAAVYNRELQDENGGIVSDTFLTSANYDNRQIIPVYNETDGFGTASTVRRSPVTNTLRDMSVMVQHGYTFGRLDTLYSKDSTRYSLRMTRRFSVTHRFEMRGERHKYKDLVPDSLRYATFFVDSFKKDDSVYSMRKWSYVDNRILLSGFIGKRANQLQFSAGPGFRADRFVTKYIIDSVYDRKESAYLYGEIKKEALQEGQWFYKAYGQFFMTGKAAGNSIFDMSLGKDIKKLTTTIEAGARQQISEAPYNYTTHFNQHDTILTSFKKESVTLVYGSINSGRLKLSAGANSYLVGNYIYINDLLFPDQFTRTFNITQVWLRKVFVWRSIVFDNEIAYQNRTNDAPVNIPSLLGRHQLSFEKAIFAKALKIATGVEVRYHSPYSPAAYSPYFNRFFYQDSYLLSNAPELSVFFNFKVKSFRAYIMGDQFQQLLGDRKNLINAPGYPAQDFMIRFGFSWVMVN